MYVRNSSALMVPPALDPMPGLCAPSSFLAPPAGAVMRARFRGMGQANCPSLEQLTGITDCSDPCQASTGNCAAISFPFAGSGSPTQPIGPTLTIAPVVATPSSLAGMNWAPWVIGGAALFLGLALLKGLK
jgi:hypothetical protein